MTSISGTVGAYGGSSPILPDAEQRSADDDRTSMFEQQFAALETAAQGQHEAPGLSVAELLEIRERMLDRLLNPPRVEDSTWVAGFRRLDPVPGQEGLGTLETHMWFPEIADLGLERARDVYDTLTKLDAEERASRRFHYGFMGPGRPEDTVPLMSIGDYEAAVKAYLDSEGTVVQDVPTVPSEPWGYEPTPSPAYIEALKREAVAGGSEAVRLKAIAQLEAWIEWAKAREAATSGEPVGDAAEVLLHYGEASDAQAEVFEKDTLVDGMQDVAFDVEARLQAWLENFKTPEQQALPA